MSLENKTNNNKNENIKEILKELENINKKIPLNNKVSPLKTFK